MKNWWLFFSLRNFLLCYEVLLSWNFRSPGFDVRPPQDPPNMKKVLFFHILGLNLKISYHIASLFHMYIYMGERIAGKQDRSSLIIEDALRAPKIPSKYFFFTFWPIKEKLVFKLFPLVVHMSPLWWGLRFLTFCPWILCKGPTWPRKN